MKKILFNDKYLLTQTVLAGQKTMTRRLLKVPKTCNDKEVYSLIVNKNKNMQTTGLNEVIAFLLGRKYSANIVATKGTDKTEICSYIFTCKEDADKHRDGLQTTRSFIFIETISFRSRKGYY